MTAPDTTQNTITLTLKGARGKVVVDGVLGLWPKVTADGATIKPRRGAWAIPVRSGGTEALTLKGWLPGFQRLLWNGEEVLELGKHVGLAERIVMFVPVLLVALLWWVAVPVMLALFLTNITIVKNYQMPRPLRIALPIVNTIAAGFLLVLIGAAL